MKAKDTSHVGMVIGAICLFGMFISVMIKLFTSDNFSISMNDAIGLIIVGCSPSIPFCPIYISTWLDKLMELKNANKEE